VFSPSRIAAGIRRTLLAVLLLLFAAIAPVSAAHAHHPAQATAPTTLVLSTLPRLPPTSDRLPEEVRQPAGPALRTLVDRVYFSDATTRFTGAPVMVGSSGILVDIDRNIILWADHEHARRAPASTAKLMTSLVALENFPLDQLVTVTPQAAAREVVETRMGLVPDEKLTVKELLSGMLTVSANDAADAIADGTVGMDQYVEAMNRQVTALGLEDTHFTNPVGFPDDPQEISSAYDLAAMATAAYRNYPLFGEITASRDISLPATSTHQAYRLRNINRLLDIYPAARGTKSGFTDSAGPCLVSLATRDGHRLVAVVMNAQKMFDQSRALLEWGFTQEGLPALYPSATPTPVTSPLVTSPRLAPPGRRRTRL